MLSLGYAWWLSIRRSRPTRRLVNRGHTLLSFAVTSLAKNLAMGLFSLSSIWLAGRGRLAFISPLRVNYYRIYVCPPHFIAFSLADDVVAARTDPSLGSVINLRRLLGLGCTRTLVERKVGLVLACPLSHNSCCIRPVAQALGRPLTHSWHSPTFQCSAPYASVDEQER